jgi:hypothetical protein
MASIENYKAVLRDLDDWVDYLLSNSGLPGPRGNLELARAVAELGDRGLFLGWAALGADTAPTNSPAEFLTFCGVVGLGHCLARGEMDLVPLLKQRANDSRWRTREAVAMALQCWGRADISALLHAMAEWAAGTLLEQRAAAAGLCEPELLQDESVIERVLDILDEITLNISKTSERRNEAFRALRKGMGYCWSVAVAASPMLGVPYLERWLACEDRDVRWAMKQNLGKKRLSRAAPEWVAAARAAF